MGEDIELHFETNVKKVYMGAEEVTVTYYDAQPTIEGEKNILYTVTVDKNSYADYVGAIPTKSETAEYSYLHCGWVDENGNAPNLARVSSNLKLYPIYEAIQKEYVDTWIVDGVKFDYDPGVPAMKTEGDIYYDFSGWKTEVDYERQTKTHTAVFEKPFVTTTLGPAKISFKGNVFVVEPAGNDDRLDLGHLISRVSGLGGISVKYPDGQVMTMSYSDVILLNGEGACSISLKSICNADAHAYTVSVFDGEGEEISSNAKFSCKVLCEITDPSHFLLYSLGDDGERKMIRYRYDSVSLTFTATAGTDYFANVEYSLGAIPIEGIVILPQKNSAISGESVKLTLEVPPGVTVDRIYYIDSSGAKFTIDGDSFVMPQDDIFIGVDYTVEQYTVSFVSDGKTIIEYLCNYGDTVSPPSNPKKASDEKYSYEFTGWSPEIKNVSENAVYTAVYAATELPEISLGNDEITEGVLRLLLLLGVGVSCLVFIVIPSLTMTLILVKRRKQHLNKR